MPERNSRDASIGVSPYINSCITHGNNASAVPHEHSVQLIFCKHGCWNSVDVD